MDRCLQYQHIPAFQTLEAIKKNLTGPSDSDDELSMLTGDLQINLADPFTAKIFQIPVRGQNCLHRECFDLETFLLTRNSKAKLPNQPCMVDVWKCPLCGYDARPYSLVIDDFLVSVRARLAEENKLDDKAILISADGSWKPKPEPEPTSRKRKANREGLDDSTDSEDEDLPLQQVQASRKKLRLASEDVIDLDSD